MQLTSGWAGPNRARVFWPGSGSRRSKGETRPGQFSRAKKGSPVQVVLELRAKRPLLVDFLADNHYANIHEISRFDSSFNCSQFLHVLSVSADLLPWIDLKFKMACGLA